MSIPVIDLFAGPGGLGEGFSSLTVDGAKRAFKIELSVEMDEHAHRTLELRAFYREFPHREAPCEYYDYLAGGISREALFEKNPDAATAASREAWLAELGSDAIRDSEVDERIHKALGNEKKWVLIGGPPCQAYSLVGRSRVIGREGREKYEADPRHKLYRHYLRILAVHRPPVFVMENVKGLLSAKVKLERTFDKILADLRNPVAAMSSEPSEVERGELEYRLIPLSAGRGDISNGSEPEDFVLRAEDYGIPQARHRIIIVGVRSDLAAEPDALKTTDRANIEDVIGDLPRLRSGLSKEPDSAMAWFQAVHAGLGGEWFDKLAFPHDFRIALMSWAEQIEDNFERGGPWKLGKVIPKRHQDWYCDPKLAGVCNHETRGHIRADLHRYFFAAVFAKIYGRSPLLEDFPEELLPKHENVAAALKETKFNDRFRVQLAGRPSTTVVSHISKDGHYFIHYDPAQCRSLTVREAARLQTFPDNYFFEGARTEQYRQVGNAVPPLLARQIAARVASFLA